MTSAACRRCFVDAVMVAHGVFHNGRPAAEPLCQRHGAEAAEQMDTCRLLRDGQHEREYRLVVVEPLG